ncbi:MAG: general secretion pathway protein G [Parcubacteria group bacterium Gr01-1014_70]|nr:MAG: general secretion pathway protein G [Parcubacteria group bacterium Gr01-1014_70]
MQRHGFTLIELMVVVSIISFLSSIVLVSLQEVRAKVRDLTRVQALKALQVAIESYKDDHGHYPITGAGDPPAVKRAECGGHPDDYIPDIVPTYVSKLPTDISLDCGGVPHSFVYNSNGIDYKLITHNETRGNGAFWDPAWDDNYGGTDDCIIDGTSSVHLGIWTPGAVCWSQ